MEFNLLSVIITGVVGGLTTAVTLTGFAALIAARAAQHKIKIPQSILVPWETYCKRETDEVPKLPEYATWIELKAYAACALRCLLQHYSEAPATDDHDITTLASLAPNGRSRSSATETSHPG